MNQANIIDLKVLLEEAKRNIDQAINLLDTDHADTGDEQSYYKAQSLRDMQSDLGAVLDEVSSKVEADPECDQCHGKGCSHCNDTIYYAQQDTYEQDKRERRQDRAIDSGEWPQW